MYTNVYSAHQTANARSTADRTTPQPTQLLRQARAQYRQVQLGTVLPRL